MSLLTDTALRRLQKIDISKDTTESDGKGLSVRVRPSKAGGKNILTWMYRYRFGSPNPKVLYLGTYPDTPLKKARNRAEKCRAWLADHKDPKIEYQLETQKSLKPLTVQQALELWVTEYAQQKRVNAQKHHQQFNKYIFSAQVGSLPLDRVEKYHWIKALKDTDGRFPVARGYVLRNLQQALKYCSKQGYEFDRGVFDIDLDDINASRQRKRSQRLVEDDSWQRLEDLVKWLNQDKVPPYYKNLVWLLLCFGCRTQELRLAKTKEFNFDTMVWTVPPEHNKTKDKDQAKGESGQIKRPIPHALVPLLQSLCADTDNEYLLGELKRPEAVSAWGGSIWKKLGHEDKWRLHDLRRTVATGLNDLGVAPHVVEALLGHSIVGVAGIYNRSQYLPEKRKALDLWLDRLHLLQNRDDNVFLMAEVANEK